MTHWAWARAPPHCGPPPGPPSRAPGRPPIGGRPLLRVSHMVDARYCRGSAGEAVLQRNWTDARQFDAMGGPSHPNRGSGNTPCFRDREHPPPAETVPILIRLHDERARRCGTGTAGGSVGCAAGSLLFAQVFKRKHSTEEYI